MDRPWNGFGTTKRIRTNKRDHGLSFETATLVFDDPLATSRTDEHPDGDRWQTLGVVGAVVVFVVHTWPEEGDNAKGRIISARKATSYERNVYQEDRF